MTKKRLKKRERDNPNKKQQRKFGRKHKFFKWLINKKKHFPKLDWMRRKHVKKEEKTFFSLSVSACSLFWLLFCTGNLWDDILYTIFFSLEKWRLWIDYAAVFQNKMILTKRINIEHTEIWYLSQQQPRPKRYQKV